MKKSKLKQIELHVKDVGYVGGWRWGIKRKPGLLCKILAMKDGFLWVKPLRLKRYPAGWTKRQKNLKALAIFDDQFTLVRTSHISTNHDYGMNELKGWKNDDSAKVQKH